MKIQEGGLQPDVIPRDEKGLFLAPVADWGVSSNSSVAQDLYGQTEVLNDGSSFLAASRSMRAIRQQIEKIADYDIPVLVLGESGTGKEVAVRSNPGKFEICKSGTILLDEIGEISPTLQAKLLHVLQDKTVCRLGGNTTVKVEARVVAATNIDICEALESGALRQDLYYRLNTFVLRVPPLRSRPEEIPALLNHFITRFAHQYGSQVSLPSSRLIAACLQHPWPGNIRELQSFTQRFLIQGDEELSIRELQPAASVGMGVPDASDAFCETSSRSLKKLSRRVRCNAEKPAIEKALQETRFNRKAAARRLQISYKGLLRKLREY